MPMRKQSIVLLGATVAGVGIIHIAAAGCMYLITYVGHADMIVEPFKFIRAVQFWYLAGGLVLAALGGGMIYKGRKL